MIEKYIRDDGKVAVLVSYGYGSGFSTWNKRMPHLVFSPYVVDLILSDKIYNMSDDEVKTGIKNWYNETYNTNIVDFCFCGRGNIYIEWVEQGKVFKIDEFNGHETIEYYSNEKYKVA